MKKLLDAIETLTSLLKENYFVAMVVTNVEHPMVTFELLGEGSEFIANTTEYEINTLIDINDADHEQDYAHVMHELRELCTPYFEFENDLLKALLEEISELEPTEQVCVDSIIEACGDWMVQYQKDHKVTDLELVEAVSLVALDMHNEQECHEARAWVSFEWEQE